MRQLVIILGLLCLLLLVAEVASAQNAPVNGFCEQGGLKLNTVVPTSATNSVQQSFASCTVTIFNFGSSTLSTIFSDAIGTAKSNPFTANSTGQWQFFAANGDYIVQISGGGLAAPYTLYSDVKITGATAGVGGSGTTNTLPVFTASATVGNSIVTQTTSGKQAIDVTGGGGFPGEIDLGNVNNANVIGFKSPANPVGSVVWTLPAADSSGCVQSNGAGVWSIASCSGVTNPVTSTNPIATNQLIIGQDGVRGAQQLGSLGSATTVLHGGAGAPSFSAVVLTTDVSGVLPVANGGLGAGTFTANGVLYGNGASVIQVTAQGAANSILIANAGAPSFSQTPTINTSLSIGVAASQTGTVSLSGGTSGTITIQPQAIAGTYNFNLPTGAGTSGQPLLSGGGGATAMTFGTLGAAGGGTGLNTGASNGVPTINAGTWSVNALTSTDVLVGGSTNNIINAVGFTYNSTTQSIIMTGTAVSGGATELTLTGGTHTAVTTNTPDVIVGAHTDTISAGYAEQDFIQIGQPTIAGAFTITNPAVMTFKGLPSASGSTLTNNSALWIQNGNTSLTIPNQNAPFTIPLAVTSTINDTNAGNFFNIGSVVENTAVNSRISVGVFGEGKASAAGASVQGGNFVAIGNSATAVATGMEADIECLVAGCSSTGVAVNVAGGNLVTVALQMSTLSTGSQFTTGMRFLKNGAVATQPFNVDLIETSGAITTNYGIDFNSATFNNAFARMPNAALFVARNAGGTTDINLVKLDASNIENFGDTNVQGFKWTPGNISTSGAEAIAGNYAANTLTVTGAVATERFWLFNAPTITGAFTTTTAATVDIVGAPIAAGGGTITNPFALRVEGGVSTFIYSGVSQNIVPTISTNYTITTPNAGNVDEAVITNLTLTANSAVNELFALGYQVNINNNMTGGGAVTTLVGQNAAIGTGAGATSTTVIGFRTNLTNSGTVTTAIGFNIVGLQGTAKYSLRDDSGSQLGLGSTTFGALPTGGNTQNGSIIYCSDCTIGATCAGAGTGALAKRINAVWVCN